MGAAEPSVIRRRHLIGLGACALAACVAAPASAQDALSNPAEEGVGTVWWVELVSSDSGPTVEYYKTTLAWGSRTSLPAGGEVASSAVAPYTLFEAGGHEVAGAVVATKSDLAKGRPLWIVYFRVDDVEKSIARALAAGGKLLQAPYDVPGSARMAVLADLDGTPFGVAAPLAV